MMSSSEFTSLLPKHRHANRLNNDSGAGDSRTNGRIWRHKMEVIAVTAVAVCLIVMAFHGSTTAAGEGGNTSVDVESVDATMLVWDKWKSHNQGHVDNLWSNERFHPNTSVNAWDQTNVLNARLETSWGMTTAESGDFVRGAVENAEQFGEHISTWWKALENKGEESISSLSIGEKEAAIQDSFQTWWDGASGAERAWWDSVVQQFQREESIGASWLKAAKQDEESIAQKSRASIESTEKAILNDETALSEKAHDAWNHTIRHVQDGEQAVAEKFALWWLITKSVAQRSLNATTEAEEEWWNATETWFRSHVGGISRQSDSPMPRPVMYLNSTAAYSLLMNGYHWMDYSADFFLLQSGWDAQVNQAYCAVASSAAVLNSLRWQIQLPIDPSYNPHPYATQASLLDNTCADETVISYNATFDGVLHAPGGLTLGQTERLLKCIVNKDWNVAANYVDPESLSVDDVRRDLTEALKNPNQRVLINYDRHAIGQDGGGHFSPLGGYSKQQDAFLVMDVAKYKYPPVWIPTERLYAAMATQDSCGDWDFPFAQDKLHSSLHLTNLDEYERAMKRLRCRVKNRGYIVVG